MTAIRIFSLWAALSLSLATFASADITSTPTSLAAGLTPNDAIMSQTETRTPIEPTLTKIASQPILGIPPLLETDQNLTPTGEQLVTSPTSTPLATPQPATLTPEPTPTNSPLVVDEPISDMLPSNVLLEEPGAVAMVEGLRQEVVAQGTCNANVCFALDGGRRISPSEYRRVQDFVQLVTAIVGVDTRAAFAAVQYGIRNVGISSLTNDVDQFLLDVDNSESVRSRRSILVGGLRFCIRELRPRREDANKIVILGNGRSRQRGFPVPVARRARRPRGNVDICAVAVGFSRPNRLTLITGSPSRVLPINGYFQLLDIIEQLVAEICDLDS